MTVTAPRPAPSTAQEKVKVVTSLASRTACPPAVVSVAEPEQGRFEPAPESDTVGSGPCTCVGSCLGTCTSVPAPTSRPDVLAAAAIGTFKGNPQPRRATRGVRAGLKDRRTPGPDTNVWKTLLEKRRGYDFAKRILIRILQLFRRAGSRPVEGTLTEALDKRAMLALFRGERENSFLVAGRRMAGGSSSEC